MKIDLTDKFIKWVDVNVSGGTTTGSFYTSHKLSEQIADTNNTIVIGHFEYKTLGVNCNLENGTIDVELKQIDRVPLNKPKKKTSALGRVKSIVASFLVVFFVAWILTPGKQNVKTNNRVKEIETRLQPIIEKTQYYQDRADNSRPLLNMIDSRFDSLNSRFENAKSLHDTVYIFAYCDSIRNDYSDYRITAKQIINDLDSASIGYRYIIKSQDTIISVQKEDIANLVKQSKKLKRQRNISLIGNAILAGLIVIL